MRPLKMFFVQASEGVSVEASCVKPFFYRHRVASRRKRVTSRVVRDAIVGARVRKNLTLRLDTNQCTSLRATRVQPPPRD